VGRHTGGEDLDADRWGAGGRRAGPGCRLGVDVPDHPSILSAARFFRPLDPSGRSILQADFADDPDELEDPDELDEPEPAVDDPELELLPESDELLDSVFVSLLVSLFDSPEPDDDSAEAFSEPEPPFAPDPARASLR
jgi:hypothetical protein